MKTRIISGLVMLPLAAVLYLRGIWLAVVVAIVAFMAAYEFIRAFEKIGYKGYPEVVGILIPAVLFAPLDSRVTMFLMFLTVLTLLLRLFRVNKAKLEDSMVTLLAAFYIVFFAYHVVLVDVSFKEPFLWLIPLAAFGTDIFAYFVGVTMGKHKLCPNISPKKSIEGAAGGILGSGLLCGLFGYFFIKEYFMYCIIIGVVVSPFSQLGDLTASIFKRKIGIKDYGNLIPGHGGILDRFDSILFAAPAVYYILSIMQDRSL